MSTDDDQNTLDPTVAVHQLGLGLSPRLRQRRFALPPLRGDDTPLTELQPCGCASQVDCT